jgi:hypothetical protein
MLKFYLEVGVTERLYGNLSHLSALYNSAGNDSLLPNFRSYGAEALDKTAISNKAAIFHCFSTNPHLDQKIHNVIAPLEFLATKASVLLVS